MSPTAIAKRSLHAFKEAVALGYRYSTDVHATRDGVLAFHDRVLDRVTDRAGAIAEMTYPQIADARIHGLDPIPQLSELLVELDARFNVDVKSAAAVTLLVATIEEHEATDRVCVASFGIRRLYELRRRLGWRVPSAASAFELLRTGSCRVTWALNTPAPATDPTLGARARSTTHRADARTRRGRSSCRQEGTDLDRR